MPDYIVVCVLAGAQFVALVLAAFALASMRDVVREQNSTICRLQNILATMALATDDHVRNRMALQIARWSGSMDGSPPKPGDAGTPPVESAPTAKTEEKTPDGHTFRARL